MEWTTAGSFLIGGLRAFSAVTKAMSPNQTLEAPKDQLPAGRTAVAEGAVGLLVTL